LNLAADIEAATLSFADGTARVRFSGREEFFRGHFPDGPVLPAVVQVAAVVHFAGLMFGGPASLAEVTRAKFMNPTGPGRELVFAIMTEPADAGRVRVKATIHDGQTQVAELTLRVSQTE